MKRANKYAGANLGKPSVIGKHTANPGYKPGEHWVECQRCGFDVYSKDTQIDDYSGIIVCNRCNDPKHPQDFVRPRPDKISADQPINVPADYDTTGAEGSTDVPASTYNITDPIG